MKVELISNVSHDLKTPLTSIISYTQLLLEEDLPPAARDYAQILAQKAERLSHMVQDVFEVSKAATGNLKMQSEQIDLCKLIRQTMADMEEKISANRGFHSVFFSARARLYLCRRAKALPCVSEPSGKRIAVFPGGNTCLSASGNNAGQNRGDDQEYFQRGVSGRGRSYGALCAR